MKQFTATIMLATLGAQAARVLDQARPYISGEITSKETFLYGKFKTKIQGSDREGTLASFLTLFLGDENEEMSFENWNHINIEIKPHDHNKVTTNLIWSGFTNESYNINNFDPADNWHTYEITWTPNYIAFSIDDEEVRRETHHEDDDESESLAVADLNKQQHLILGFWLPKWTEEHFEDDETMPWYTRYDYVEAYDWKGKNESTGEDMFELRFKEDFDTFDTDRWRKSSYAIGDSNAKFEPENAYIEDGKLVLKMERADGTSGTDKQEDWQVLPPPQPDSLDMAIEKTTRVVVTMVRNYLDDFSESMAHHLQ